MFLYLARCDDDAADVDDTEGGDVVDMADKERRVPAALHSERKSVFGFSLQISLMVSSENRIRFGV